MHNHRVAHLLICTTIFGGDLNVEITGILEDEFKHAFAELHPGRLKPGESRLGPPLDSLALGSFQAHRDTQGFAGGTMVFRADPQTKAGPPNLEREVPQADRRDRGHEYRAHVDCVAIRNERGCRVFLQVYCQRFGVERSAHRYFGLEIIDQRLSKGAATVAASRQAIRSNSLIVC